MECVPVPLFLDFPSFDRMSRALNSQLQFRITITIKVMESHHTRGGATMHNDDCHASNQHKTRQMRLINRISPQS